MLIIIITTLFFLSKQSKLVKQSKRSELEWDGEIRDESELGILEEAHL